MNYPSYSVAIRTLGKSGDLFVRMIRSLKEQTVPAEQILVYIAEGYDAPAQIADEQYITCPKGMATQRALPYSEATSEFLLLCDDDILFEPDSVRKLFDALLERRADCISPNVFPNHQMGLKEKLINMAFYGTFPSCSRKWAFRIRRSSYYSYCNRPVDVMPAQSCAGPCILMKKSVNDALHYRDEIWLDQVPYTSGQDQVFAYKLYRYGYKMLIHYASGVVHLDAQTGHIKDPEKADYNKRLLRYVIWYRTLYEPDKWAGRCLDVLSFYAYWTWLLLLAIFSFCIGRNKYKVRNSVRSLREARRFVRSDKFNQIPKWTVKR